MKVREVLTPLVKTALTRLCRQRDLPVRGTKGEILKRLAYSYHGDLSALVLDLRRQELIAKSPRSGRTMLRARPLWAASSTRWLTRRRPGGVMEARS